MWSCGMSSTTGLSLFLHQSEEAVGRYRPSSCSCILGKVMAMASQMGKMFINWVYRLRNPVYQFDKLGLSSLTPQSIDCCG